jgi:DNA-binding MarR family transcriptional regulator
MLRRDLEIIMSFPRVIHHTMRKLRCGFHGSQPELNQLNDTQRRTLLYLDDKEAMTMTQLHRFIGLEKGSLTSVVDQLIKKSLVQRKRVAGDRRKVEIDLTAFGKNKVGILKKEIAEYIHGKLQQLTPDDRKRFYQAVETLSDISRKL